MAKNWSWIVRRQVQLAAGLAIATVVSACAGGGASGVAGPSTPPVTFVPIVVQPPPVFAYPHSSAAFYTTVHSTIIADVVTAALPNGSRTVQGLTGVNFIPSPAIGNFEYKGPDNYAFEFAGFGGPSFGPGAKAASTANFDVFRNVSPPHITNLEIDRRDVGVQFTYLTFGTVTASLDAPDRVEITHFVAGGRTRELPRTGTANYTGVVDGLWIDGANVRRLYGSSATLSANFASGQVTSVLNLTGRSDPFGDFAAGTATTLGTFTGTGNISNGNFGGTYAPTAGYSGTFLGTFFGPVANEYGLSFILKGGPDQVVTGASAGRQ